LARFFARGEIQLAGHAERDPDPLARSGIFGRSSGRNRAASTLELSQQLERPVA
jgi:hypothetical protein